MDKLLNDSYGVFCLPMILDCLMGLTKG